MTAPLVTLDPSRPTLKLVHEIRAPERDQWTICAGDDVLLLIHTHDDGHIEVRDARRPARPVWSRYTGPTP